MAEYLCGSICTKYISDKLNLNQLNMNKQMSWISELALYLNQHNLEVELYCNNSNLYTDFVLGNYDPSFSGFIYLNEIKKQNIRLNEKRLNKETLMNEIDDNDYLILCVESKVFNNDEKFTGGHFIVLENRDNEIVRVINPTIDNYETINLELDFLVKCCKNYGEWRLLIRRK
jgi:hypothetical protein